MIEIDSFLCPPLYPDDVEKWRFLWSLTAVQQFIALHALLAKLHQC